MSGNLKLFLTSAQDSLLIISRVNTRSVQFIKIGAKIGAITRASDWSASRSLPVLSSLYDR
jgi:hypothetical protein